MMLFFLILLFIGFFALIYFMVDVFIDNLKEICYKFDISPLIIGLLILGIDLEELVASLFSSINGLPYIAIGNVIGNSIISLTIGFGLPALLFKLDFEKVSLFYPSLLLAMGGSIIIGILIPFGLFYAGLFNISMFIYYVIRNLWKYKSTKDVEIHIVEEEEEEGEEGQDTKKNIILIIISFILIFIGGEGLIITADLIIKATLIAETFFGLVIISMLTNVEEFLMIYKSIKKKEPQIGIGGMIGKIFWNLGITFGVSSLIIFNISGSLIIIYNWILLISILGIYLIIIKKGSMFRIIGTILTSIFVIFLILNFIFI
ncbi:MAG: hypothetical protein EAX96_13865 [Candidatus Lokiarchaeota archaeon]|nr:hypothetical protein [Candidatus Lokiarchaeota archaeon]